MLESKKSIIRERLNSYTTFFLEKKKMQIRYHLIMSWPCFGFNSALILDFLLNFYVRSFVFEECRESFFDGCWFAALISCEIPDRNAENIVRT